MSRFFYFIIAILMGFQLTIHALDGLGIMKQVAARPLGNHTAVMAKLKITDDNGGERRREFRLFSADEGSDRYSILFFTAPSDLVNAGFLTIDYLDNRKSPDMQWLYLSAFQKAKRIAGDDRSKRFMGSDFSYYDMTRIDVEAFNFSLVETSDRGGKPLYKITSTPKSPEVTEQTGYTKSVYWVQPDPYVVVSAVHTLKNGDQKQFQVLDTTIQNGITFITRSTMKTLRDGKVTQRSELGVDRIEFRPPYPRSLFTTKRLEEGL